MATFDQLSPEQRAIVELVLQQGKTYDELVGHARTCPRGGCASSRATRSWSWRPVSVRGVEEDWRGQLADYVLGQQSGPEATATKGHLRRSEAARSWARSLLDSLEQLYENGSVPAIPEGERGRARRAAAGAAAAARSRTRGRPGARRPTRVMRRAADRRAAGGAACSCSLVVLVWPVGLLTGDDDNSSSAEHDAERGTSTDQRATSQAAAAASRPASRSSSSGTASSSCSSRPPASRRAARARATTCGSTTARTTPSRSAARSPTSRATTRRIGAFPADYAKYKYIDVSRQPVGKDPNVKHSGESVLRGPMPKLQGARTRQEGRGDRPDGPAAAAAASRSAAAASRGS